MEKKKNKRRHTGMRILFISFLFRDDDDKMDRECQKMDRQRKDARTKQSKVPIEVMEKPLQFRFNTVNWTRTGLRESRDKDRCA